MRNKKSIQKIKLEIQNGMKITKCKKCSCMKEALENLLRFLPSVEIKESKNLIQDVNTWLKGMQPIKYTCLGCKHCFAAVAINVLTSEFPEWTSSLSCEIETKKNKWPFVPGEYFAFCEGDTCPVAVSTLASPQLAKSLADKRPKELCIVGKTETENIGIDKIIKNTITNSTIRVLILTGEDPKGHYSGRTLLALWKNGVDENMKVIDSPGRRPILKNVIREEVETFRKQVQVIDMIGCEDTKKIIKKIEEISENISVSCKCEECGNVPKPVQISNVPKIQAEEPAKTKMDKAGYFVVIPQPEKGVIALEHYSYDNKLLRIIEGKDAPAIYSTIIQNGWITQLTHAAYLGRELARAELSMKYGFRYIQDKAPGKMENT